MTQQAPPNPAAEMRGLSDTAVDTWYRECRERVAVAAAQGQRSGRDPVRLPSHLMGPVMARLRADGFRVHPVDWETANAPCNLFISWERHSPKTNKLLIILFFLLLVELAVAAALAAL